MNPARARRAASLHSGAGAPRRAAPSALPTAAAPRPEDGDEQDPPEPGEALAPAGLVVLFIASSICLVLAAIGVADFGPAAAVASIAAPFSGYHILEALRARVRNSARRSPGPRWSADPGPEGIVDDAPEREERPAVRPPVGAGDVALVNRLPSGARPRQQPQREAPVHPGGRERLRDAEHIGDSAYRLSQWGKGGRRDSQGGGEAGR